MEMIFVTVGFHSCGAAVELQLYAIWTVVKQSNDVQIKFLEIEMYKYTYTLVWMWSIL